METHLINAPGNWSFWTADEKRLLEQNRQNTDVGEKMVFENAQLKIWIIHLKPHHSLPFHKHCKNYIWTALSEGKSVSYRNDGSVTETVYSTGDTRSFENLSEENYFIHNLKNTGNTTLIFSTIEFKD